MFGSVGTDIYTGVPRFTFGFPEMTKSISLIALAMGVYGITEIITSLQEAHGSGVSIKETKDLSAKPNKDDIHRFWPPTLRGSALGSFLGMLPGAGALVATFMSYAVEKRVARNREQLGKGAVEGIVAPEAAAGSAEMTGFIPTLTLGIPSSPSMVLMAGALIVQGITPGPALMNQHPELFWGVIMSFWIGNLMLLILNIPMIGLWVRMLQIPYHYLFPSILVFICIGSFVESFSAFDVWMTVLFGLMGWLLRIASLPVAPMLLGFVLGPQMEDNFRRTMLLSDGDLMIFVQRPILVFWLSSHAQSYPSSYGQSSARADSRNKLLLPQCRDEAHFGHAIYRPRLLRKSVTMLGANYRTIASALVTDVTRPHFDQGRSHG